MTRDRVNPLAVCSVALGVALAATLSAWGASLPVGQKRTDVKIETKNGNPANASARAGDGPVPLTRGSLAPAQAVEVRPYVAIPDTNDTHTLRVWSRKAGS